MIAFLGFRTLFTAEAVPTDQAIGYWVMGVLSILLVILAIYLVKDAVAAIGRFVTEGPAEAATPPPGEET